MPFGFQPPDQMPTDKSAGAGYQNLFRQTSPRSRCWTAP
jgi:hypothetical protein